MRHLAIGLLAGAVISIAASAAAEAGKETVLYSFDDSGTDAWNPSSGLIYLKGSLYGVTIRGGKSNTGTVFAIKMAGDAESVLHSFGDKFGDGADPVGTLLNIDGTFYGTTLGGGTGYGTAFRINPANGDETVLYAFRGGQSHDGGGPVAGMINVKGTLYGTTEGGGDYQVGTLFSLNPRTKTEVMLHSFCGAPCKDGSVPNALVEIKGVLYGSTSMGGRYDGGTVFSFDASTRTENVLYSFKRNDKDGCYPEGGLIAVNGALYGTTVAGGATEQGTVFKFDLATGNEKVLYTFQAGHDGAQPNAGLLSVGTKLYGTTADGGDGACDYGCGTVFSFNPSSGEEKVTYAFQSEADGIGPLQGLLDVKDALYGTTPSGGVYNYGTVFKVRP